MDLKAQILDLLQQAYDEEQWLVARLRAEERAAVGSVEKWTVKDVIAHTAAWKARLVDDLEAAARGQEPPLVGDIDEANAAIFREHSGKSIDEVMAYSAEAHQRLMKYVNGLEEGELLDTQRLPRQHGRPLWQVLLGSGSVHPVMHLGEIMARRGDREHADGMQERMAAQFWVLDEGKGWRGAVRYNLACHYAICGDTGKARALLDEALELNPGLREWAQQDPDLASLR